MIRTYSCNIDNIKDNDLSFFINAVSEDRKSRIVKMKSLEDVKRSLLAELLVRRIARDIYGIGNEKISFSVKVYGKPYIKELEDFYFNISHSGEWVVCAVGNQDVGIDIEKIKPLTKDIVCQHFSREENRVMSNLDLTEKKDYFFRLWTLKESYLKTKGLGLIDNLSTTDFSNCNGNLFLMPHEEMYFRIYENFSPGYSLSVCGHENDFDPDIKRTRIEYTD